MNAEGQHLSSHMTVVVTTIQAPTRALNQLAIACETKGIDLVVVGDRRTPADFALSGSRYLSRQVQDHLFGSFSRLLSDNSYTRKMLGYLDALHQGSKWIAETDDDNFPLDLFLQIPPEEVSVRIPLAQGWINPYRYFTSRHIWPRGLPLEEIEQSRHAAPTKQAVLTTPYVEQGLANGDPDVDAIYRLVAEDPRPVDFDDDDCLCIPRLVYAPFNSQATKWPREFAPLLYLPSSCAFRLTDIWRGFVALRILHEIGASLVFTRPSVFQERNHHDLLRDFVDEVDGYKGNAKIVRLLEDVDLQGQDLCSSVRSCYKVLIDEKILAEWEMGILDAWLRQVTEIT